MARVAINGFGRIGRAAFKIIRDTPELDLVAINDIAPVVMAWYDNEWGFTNQMIREALRIAETL